MTNRMNENEVEKVVGGGYWDNGVYWRNAWPEIQSGYLALRNYPAWDDSNEIAQINQGEWFVVNTDRWSGDFVWARYCGMEGWVNSNYCGWE